jgi:hypothetical protein
MAPFNTATKPEEEAGGPNVAKTNTIIPASAKAAGTHFQYGGDN